MKTLTLTKRDLKHLKVIDGGFYVLYQCIECEKLFSNLELEKAIKHARYCAEEWWD